MTTAPRVLVVEDEPNMRESLQDVLELRGYVVDTAATARAGLECARRTALDAAVLDIRLPDESGVDLLRRLRHDFPHVPVVLMTANASMQTAVEAINETAFAYLVKPFEIDELVAVLGRAVETQRLRRALRESEARYRLIMDTILDAVFMLDVEGRLVYANRSAEAMSGYRLDELVGRPAFSFFTPESAAELAARLSAAPGGSGVAPFVELHFIRKDGVLVRLETHETPIMVEGRVIGRLGVARDITERERLRERLAQTQNLALMGKLLAGIAHELNNPLTVLGGYASMLARHADPFVAERAGRIQTAAERCARIVSSFVALARSRPQERRPVDVNRIVRAAVELLAYPLHVDNIKVTQQLDDRLPAIWADGHQLQQVVVNLVANAHHALRGVEGQRRLTLTTRRQPVPEAVVLEVADTGSGIPDEVRPRLFEPFFTTKRAGEGIGLGLALCQGVIEGHGGRIEVESEPGRGACFRIVLPVGEPVEGPVVPSSAGADLPATIGDILVVDDEAEIAALLTEVLVGAGHHVDTASNGLDALEHLARRRYDVIVSDIRMPGLDGPGLYRATVEQRPDLARRFVFVTGDTFDPATRDFLERTRLPIIEKPLVVDEVRRQVAQTLGATASSTAGEPVKMDEVSLRARASEKLERGGLPRAPEAMLWAAPGTNEPCALCDQPIRPDDMEHEVHVRLGAEVKRFPFHRHCHAVWELERARAG